METVCRADEALAMNAEQRGFIRFTWLVHAHYLLMSRYTLCEKIMQFRILLSTKTEFRDKNSYRNLYTKQ